MSAATADGYVRVSRRAGREGESFISPEVQRGKIADWAKLHEVEVVAWWEEIDQSGAKLQRPMFQQALERCERGESGGIIVARLDRFARSAVDALESIKRLNQAGARLVSVEDNFDGSTPMGRFAIGILTLIAELELERIKESWNATIESAVGRGIHISARVPVGYTRNAQTRRLEIDPRTAPVVAELFRRRALGASWAELTQYLEDNKVYPSTGNTHWSRVGVSSLVKNPVYLGQARSGKVVKEHAHEPIVTRAEFDAAQAVKKSLFSQHDRSIASQALLGGLVRCAGCGHTLKITGNTRKKTGERYATYYCVGRYAAGFCPARANITAPVLDPWVESKVFAALQTEGGVLAEAHAESEQLEQLQADAAEAEHELDLFISNPRLLSILGEQKFVEGVQVRQRALDEARQRLATAHSQRTIIADLTEGDLLASWPQLSVQEKRLLMHGLLERVEVTRATARGAAREPLDQRVRIILRGGSEL